jgi:hypothetical protein
MRHVAKAVSNRPHSPAPRDLRLTNHDALIACFRRFCFVADGGVSAGQRGQRRDPSCVRAEVGVGAFAHVASGGCKRVVLRRPRAISPVSASRHARRRSATQAR